MKDSFTLDQVRRLSLLVVVIGFVTPNSVDIPLLVSVVETEARYSYNNNYASVASYYLYYMSILV